MENSRVVFGELSDCFCSLMSRPIKAMARHNRCFLAALAAGIFGCATSSYAQTTWQESGDAGELVGTAQKPLGSGPLTTITGMLEQFPPGGPVDMYCIEIPDPALFSATLSPGEAQDNPLFLFNAGSMGVTSQEGFYSFVNGGPSPSTIANMFGAGPGTYYLAIGTHDKFALNPSSQFIWTMSPPQDFEAAPNGPGAPGPLQSWSHSTWFQPEFEYTINLTGANYCGECVSPPADMVAWWPLDETVPSTAEDIIGTNDGEHFCTPTFGPGKVAGALRVTRGISATNGNHNWVVVPYSPDFDFGVGSFTIDAWIFPEPCSLLAQGELNCHPRPIVSNWAIAAITAGFNFFVDSGALGITLASQTILSGGSSSVVDNEWQHVAVTVNRNDNFVTFYYNGAPLPNPVAPGTASVTSPFHWPMNLGHSPVNISSDNCSAYCGVTDFFNGWLDEIEVFSRALDPAEIMAIYEAGIWGKCKPTALGVNAKIAQKRKNGPLIEQRLDFIGGCPCEGASDCDDGLFCNGQETCDDKTCIQGTNPCSAGVGCDEVLDMCMEPTIPTVSEWGLLVLALLLLIGATICISRHETATAL